jgi:hypothetical protein
MRMRSQGRCRFTGAIRHTRGCVGDPGAQRLPGTPVVGHPYSVAGTNRRGAGNVLFAQPLDRMASFVRAMAPSSHARNRTCISTSLRHLLIAALAVYPMAVGAVPVPSGTTAADDLVINFDYVAAGIAPAPPYGTVITNLSFVPPFTGAAIVIDLFGGLNGANPIRSTSSFPFFVITDTLTDTEVLDGVFSIGVRSMAGSADLAGAFSHAIALIHDFTTIPPITTIVLTSNVVGQIVEVPTNVDEPATLALLALGLASGAFCRRRAGRPS